MKLFHKPYSWKTPSMNRSRTTRRQIRPLSRPTTSPNNLKYNLLKHKYQTESNFQCSRRQARNWLKIIGRIPYNKASVQNVSKKFIECQKLMTNYAKSVEISSKTTIEKWLISLNKPSGICYKNSRSTAKMKIYLNWNAWRLSWTLWPRRCKRIWES